MFSTIIFAVSLSQPLLLLRVIQLSLNALNNVLIYNAELNIKMIKIVR